MGTWNMASGYDSLNRLSAATVTPPAGSPQYMCWSYDGFGNRTDQMITTGAGFNAGSDCNPSGSATLGPNEWAHYTVNGADNGKNQITETPGGTWQYDGAGNVTKEENNYYAYNGAGRLCAFQGPGGAFGYVYDAEGKRVAKGTITPIDPTTQTLTCANNGFTLTETYIYAGNQVTTLDGSGNWIRTDVTVEGKLAATLNPGPEYATSTLDPSASGSYDLHFHITDALGTRRVETDPWGWSEQGCSSGPFGDTLSCDTLPNAPPSAADAATPKHFTGKERDQESGNDYFGARYYASTMGRFLSPDWAAGAEAVPYANFTSPQSLNLYAFVGNNPLSRVDPDGHVPFSWGGFEGCDGSDPTCQANMQEQWKAQAAQQAQQAQQQSGQDPTLPTEVQPPPPSTADKVMSALMPKSPLDLALLVGTDGLGELGAALSRALELSSAMGKTADFVTLAVTETKEGTTVVSSSEKALRPAVRALLKPGEVAANGAGHAEVTGVNAARQMGLTPTGVAASRGICPSCADFLRTAGVAALSALKGVLPF